MFIEMEENPITGGNKMDNRMREDGMADNGRMDNAKAGGPKIDNSQLEALIETFAKDRTNENFVKVMEQLEKSVLYVPALMPENLDKEALECLREGKGTKLSENAKIRPILLQKTSGEQALPVFSSLKQVPKDKKNPAMLAAPFFHCVAMAMANQEKVQMIVLNPYTHNIILPPKLLEVAQKRSQQIQAQAQPKTQKVKLTEKQFHQMANGIFSYTVLPSFLFDKKKEGLEQLQREEGKFLSARFAAVYPKEIRMPYREEDFSLMTLNVTEDMQITRIDMPETTPDKELPPLCCRIYVVWKRETEELLYYTIEQAGNGSMIGRIGPDKKHETLEAAPDNGMEIETIMKLAEGNH